MSCVVNSYSLISTLLAKVPLASISFTSILHVLGLMIYTYQCALVSNSFMKRAMKTEFDFAKRQWLGHKWELLRCVIFYGFYSSQNSPSFLSGLPYLVSARKGILRVQRFASAGRD